MEDVTLQRTADAVLKVEGMGALSMPFLVVDCNNDGSIEVTDYFINLFAQAAQTGKYTILVPTGDYWIRPDRIFMPAMIQLISIGRAAFITKENSIYNIMMRIGSGCKIKDMIFDQRGDTVRLPTRERGCHILHIIDADNYELDGNVLYGYGVTSFLAQPNNGFGNNIKITNNTAYWERGTTTYFDSTVFNIDGMSGEVHTNKVIISKKTGVDAWKAESGFEIHSPNMNAYNNTVYNCINGILHVQNPMLQSVYDSRQTTRIYNNNIFRCVRGIISWGSCLREGIINRNLDIYDNYVTTHLEPLGSSYYYPEVGIGLVDGQPDGSYFKNVRIHDNQIQATYDSSLNVRSILDYGREFNHCAIGMVTNNSCEDIDVNNNDIDFPYGGVNIIALQARGTNQHKRIRVFNNKLKCSYYHVSGDVGQGYSSVYNIETADDVDIFKNRIYNDPIDILCSNNSTNIRYETG